LKRSQLLAVTVVALFLVALVPAQVTQGAGSYTEKLNVYVAGSDALWYFTFGGVNGSSRLSVLESSPGLSWYNITAIKTTGWASDFQIFGPKGYNLIPVPFIPSQGLFLTIGSDSFSDASAAASALDSYLLTSFTSYSNGTGTFTFYSPVSFGDLVPGTLLKFLPSGEGGFAKAIAGTTFSTLASPFIVLEGVKSTSGFSHNLVVGSISGNALTNSQPGVMGYFGSSVTFLRASNQSSSSVVQLNFLDGTVKSTDTSAVTKNTPQFSGSYTLTLAPGKRVSKVNATVVELPARLLASRAVDVGVLRTNDNLAVTLTLRNLSPSLSISKLAFTDNWWNKTGVFKFLSGNYTVNTTLGPGGTVTPVYRLQYTGTAAGTVTLPASVVRYSYTVNGAVFNATTTLNPIRLSLGAEDAVVYATLVPTGGYGKSVGATQDFNITVTNVGTLPASSVSVAGHSIPGLAAKSGSQPGGTASVSVTQSAAGLTGENVTKAYSATYQDPAGKALNSSTNVISDVFSHASMMVGYAELTVTSQIKSLQNQQTNLTLSFATTNIGPANITSFKSTGVLPPGLGCGQVPTNGIGNMGITCSGSVVTIQYPLVNKSSTLTGYMKYNLTVPLNYVVRPFSFHGTTSGFNMTGRSNPAAVPAGLVVSKQFTPSQLFGGMSSTVTVAATNAGPLPAYNATVSSTVDSFDSVAASTSLSKTSASLAPHGNATLTYGVTLQQVSGTQTAAAATATFYFGGAQFSIQSLTPKLQVYQPLGVFITTSPQSPEEGKNFTINIKVTNPTAVQVSSILFTLPVPSGLGISNLVNAQLSGGVLTVSAGTLGPHGNLTASARAVASSGITVPFSGAKLTFSYAGATIAGAVPKSSGIGIAENVTTRYIIPTAFIILAAFAVAYYVRRKAATVPAPLK
jgi:hypothetical protein